MKCVAIFAVAMVMVMTPESEALLNLLNGGGGNGGLLGGVLGNNGLLGGILGSNGLLGGLLGQNGLVGGLLGSNGLIGGVLGGNKDSVEASANVLAKLNAIISDGVATKAELGAALGISGAGLDGLIADIDINACVLLLAQNTRINPNTLIVHWVTAFLLLIGQL
ncbi:hypothetical protein LOTGIDRAFT_176992 [Lottia gigantea]|uniref:Uncharacterized protein n=1 Tax=Lottia gigantea TaxID=225164 RepID=V4AKE2_LOTGI|nr:hypothetical protein LOTGIDRAFT_176992 [Lottia gigantea]ESP04664.1 hypothetical protein LOTGIDRAFT_176992 [Lottia gigantea]